MFLKRFIQRFCYRSAKRLMRLFIYFSIISVLVVNCFALPAYNFQSFSDLVGDGYLELYGGMDYVIEYPLKEITSNFNDFTVSDGSGARFNSFAVNVVNSSNFNASVSTGDVFLLSHFIHIHSESGSAYYSNAITDNVRLIIHTSSGDYSIVGDDFVQDINIYHLDGFDNTTFYVNVNFTFPSGTDVYGIEYRFYNIFDSGLVSCRFIPLPNNVDHQGFFFYMGSPENAPLYPSFGDTSDLLEETDEQINDLLTENDTNSSFSTFTSTVQSIFNNYDFLHAFQFMRDMFDWFLSKILGVRYLVYFSICFGLYAFMLNIVPSLVSSFSHLSNKKER